MRMTRRGRFARALAALLGLAGAAAVAAAPLWLDRRDGGVRIVFEGVLQSSESVGGPWTDVPGANSPRIELAADGQRFYRVREGGGLFEATSPITFELVGAFQAHFDLAMAGIPDGIFPPVREKPWFEGVITLGGLTRPVQLRVRGNSSLQECPFPKLKLKISKEDRAGTPFEGTREIKIGTHCAEGGRGTIGRLRNEAATYREALAYEVMRELGFVAPRVRRAKITYRDSTQPGGATDSGWVIMRSALVFEDVELVAERMGGRALSDEEVGELSEAGFEEDLIVLLRLLHALLGNWDYALSMNGEELWNTDVIELPEGRFVPMPGDFDLASWVTGELLVEAPHDYHPELPDLERQMRFKLEQIRSGVSPASYREAQALFLSRQRGIEDLVESADLDAAGRTNAVRHVEAFFSQSAWVEGKR